MIKISDTEYFSNDKTIRFLRMDCNDFMAGCKKNEFDLNLSDPPYGIGINHNMGRRKGDKHSGHKKVNWDNFIPTEDVIENIFKTSKNQIIWGGNYFTLPPTKSFIIWRKPQICEKMSFSMCEYAYTSHDKTAKVIDLISTEDKIHPTQKPIELYCWILDNYTKPTDTILDCFGGSMSNAIACHMKRRKLTIIELDVDYFKSALNRFEIYERQVEDIKEFGYAKTKINAQNPVLF